MRWCSTDERLQRIESVIDDIKREAGDETVILVEGRNDEEALSELGVNADIIQVRSNGKSIDHTAETVSLRYNSAIVLTDWDRNGEELKLKLKKHLEYYGVKPDTIHRHRLEYLTSKEIHDVESLATHRKHLKENI